VRSIWFRTTTKRLRVHGILGRFWHDWLAKWTRGISLTCSEIIAGRMRMLSWLILLKKIQIVEIRNKFAKRKKLQLHSEQYVLQHVLCNLFCATCSVQLVLSKCVMQHVLCNLFWAMCYATCSVKHILCNMFCATYSMLHFLSKMSWVKNSNSEQHVLSKVIWGTYSE
jgi:formate/nitrite transporter FocA (FNT family)